MGLVSNKPRIVVPPTPYYYGLRAELFLYDAEQALLRGDTTKHATMMLKAVEYQTLAGQLPLEEGQDDQLHESQVQQVRHGDIRANARPCFG